jgi:DnaK suppressor protein
MANNMIAAKREEFLGGLKQQLLEMKAKILAEIDSEQKAEREANKDEGLDAYDLASEERDREINFILSDRERAKIRGIDEVLTRMEDGSYGDCEACGLEIAEERLEAMPFTRMCRDCQQDQEREARTQRREDDERNASYRKIGSSDADEG